MTGANQCEHGQLARVCLTCEQAAEIERLRDQLHLAEVVRASQVEGLTQGAAGWRERANQLEAEVAGLREFVGKVLGTHREHGCCDIDGSDVQDWALAAGLLHEVEVTESCGAEDCACMEYYGEITEQYPAKCLRLTDAARAALAARKGTT